MSDINLKMLEARIAKLEEAQKYTAKGFDEVAKTLKKTFEALQAAANAIENLSTEQNDIIADMKLNFDKAAEYMSKLSNAHNALAEKVISLEEASKNA